ncbi:hypothetical protein BDR22DRAFT_295748 [Usnea florida]
MVEDGMGGEGREESWAMAMAMGMAMGMGYEHENEDAHEDRGGRRWWELLLYETVSCVDCMVRYGMYPLHPSFRLPSLSSFPFSLFRIFLFSSFIYLSVQSNLTCSQGCGSSFRFLRSLRSPSHSILINGSVRFEDRDLSLPSLEGRKEGVSCLLILESAEWTGF